MAPPPPHHVAIIMDGNGRWAQGRGLPRWRGHEAGVDAVRAVTRECRRLGVRVLTLYSFSSENWGRPQDEVDALMTLLGHYLHAEREEILDQGIHLVASGELECLPAPVLQTLTALDLASRGGTAMVLNLALSYGGRQEIVRAARLLAEEVQAGLRTPDSIDEAAFASRLWHPELPPPDLVIRTGGEMRLSNFLLWQAAYAEFWSSPLPWPEFREPDLHAAFLDYQRRQRRFGLTGEQHADGELS